MSYQRVIDCLQEHDLSWNDVDRILLQEETYTEFCERASFDPADHYTSEAPAVRETTGTEKVVYVTEGGIEVTLEL